VDGNVIRRRSESFADHYSQATLFWNSMSDWEKQHISDALVFELGHVQREYIRERMVEHLAKIDHDLGSEVAEGLGLEAPSASGQSHGNRSPALSQAEQPGTVETRRVAVLAADGVDTSTLEPVLEQLRSRGAVCEILGSRAGSLNGLTVAKPLQAFASVLYDAVLVAGGRESAESLRSNGAAMRYVAEAYKHYKPVGALGEGVELLREAPLNGARLSDDGLVDEAGVVTLANSAGELDRFATAFAEAIAQHRFFERETAVVPA
jgi:catalase